MNEDLESRLVNYKFSQALGYLGEEDKKTKKLVEFLAVTFGNSGWVSGDMKILINNALENIGVEF